MALVGLIRRYMWTVPVLIGLVFVGAGAYMISEGLVAKDDVHHALVAEEITTSEDASIPGALVDSVSTAKAQEALITEHTLGELGPYSGMERDDPDRETYINGVTLRTALNQAVIGFKVADLVVGVGMIVLVIGLTNIAVMAPVLFWTREGTTKG
jgi:hypothetical protein